MILDKCGYKFADLVMIQHAHLLTWKFRLRSELFEHIQTFVLSQNEEANDANGKHRVYRGQDLIEIIRQWPDLNSVYSPVKPEPQNPTDLI